MQETLQSLLQQRLGDALSKLHMDRSLAVVIPAADTRFGDYQTNAAMVIAKQAKKNPREIAQQLIEQLQVDDISLTPEIAGPGFINFRLTISFLEKQLTMLSRSTLRCAISGETANHRDRF